jgi:acyl dehydratase
VEGRVSLPVVIPSLSDVKTWEQTPLGVSDWVTVSQDRIDRFADATDDRQWIHVDVERARREGPWKGTIAHGYLTLALIPELLSHLVVIQGWKRAVNTGIDKLRFSAPVPAGSRVRLKAAIKDAREVPPNALRVTFAVRVEVEGNAKPALIANVNYVYYPD